MPSLFTILFPEGTAQKPTPDHTPGQILLQHDQSAQPKIPHPPVPPQFPPAYGTGTDATQNVARFISDIFRDGFTR